MLRKVPGEPILTSAIVRVGKAPYMPISLPNIMLDVMGLPNIIM